MYFVHLPNELPQLVVNSYSKCLVMLRYAPSITMRIARPVFLPDGLCTIRISFLLYGYPSAFSFRFLFPFRFICAMNRSIHRDHVCMTRIRIDIIVVDLCDGPKFSLFWSSWSSRPTTRSRWLVLAPSILRRREIIHMRFVDEFRRWGRFTSDYSQLLVDSLLLCFYQFLIFLDLC